MANTVLYMSMSLDGFITGPDDGPREGLGRNGHRLHDWLAEGELSPESYRPQESISAQVFTEMMRTGAVITGRRTFEHAGQWGGDHHDGVSIFVLTRNPPANAPLGSARYVTDAAGAVREAKQAAGDRDVMVHGASTAQSLLREGLLDEMEIHLVPVLLGQGRRMFDNLPPQHVELALTRCLDAPGITHLHYRVR